MIENMITVYLLLGLLIGLYCTLGLETEGESTFGDNVKRGVILVFYILAITFTWPEVVKQLVHSGVEEEDNEL